MKRLNNCICFFAILLLASCGRSGGFGFADGGSGAASGSGDEYESEKLSPSEYVRWVEDERNGLKQEKTIDDMKYSVQYKPYDYIVCEEEKKNMLPDSIEKKELKELNGMQYIDLKIALQSGEGELLKYKLPSVADYDARVSYFSFGMQKDVQMIQSGDTLPCVLFHFERIFDVAPYATFILAFPLGRHPEADKTLQFSDHVFNKGVIKFFFEGKAVQHIPGITTI